MEFASLEGVAVVLVYLAVFSIIFEIAVTPLFSWRIFVKYLGGQGWKFPIITGLAFAVFWGYNMDIVYALLEAMGMEGVEKGIGGQALTALLIAGGSKGVHQILDRIKFLNRAVKTPAVLPAPKPEDAKSPA